MSFKRAVKQIQGILGICYEDAVLVVDGVSYRDRKHLLKEACDVAKMAADMSDEELISAIDNLLD